MRWSFEFFPPKTDAAAAALDSVAAHLAALEPEYFTVTYGAGGSTRDGTLATAARIQGATGVPVAAHLTYMTTPRDALMAYAAALADAGIRRVVALRGDLPEGKAYRDFAGPGYFQSTPEFIEALRAAHGFDILVAAYPEMHPDAASPQADLATLAEKCAAAGPGAAAITQFFFDNAPYWNLAARARAAGITAPIVPGLLPVTDFAGMTRFAARCQASVPGWLQGALAERGPAAVLAEQIRALAEGGVEHVHVYTLNRADVVEAAIKLL